MFRTKEQRDILCHSCPFAKSANLLGDTVSLFILRELLEKEKSFGELEDALHGVSTRTISEKLKKLESSNLLTREEVAGKPTRVYYRIEPHAKKAFMPVETALLSFGNEFFHGEKEL